MGKLILLLAFVGGCLDGDEWKCTATVVCDLETFTAPEEAICAESGDEAMELYKPMVFDFADTLNCSYYREFHMECESRGL